MASIQREVPIGRDFTAEELIGRQIRIEGPVPHKKRPPIGCAMLVIADDEMVGNVSKIVLTIEPNSIVEAILTLYLGETAENQAITKEVTLRDNIELSFSAIVSEAQ